ncbi:ribbon-helix-helix domain-containing protein [Gloeothece verrucosa]|uniref:Putative transcriptional regulator, CopG/Arc/MetJ family n=1 Tax=Gloeothece verrucosa (strain PCC 7822) TaxID=497965 RepID=E0UNX8_GLOV7|nr:type II toxin-antitoxin system ParD family antitoxin [Gloeothece verrucosa]ADN18658.1 putative transcriptional regulator, CopG/Arc/MetJ family [Gloeothece verrucosa PCC 7822]
MDIILKPEQEQFIQEKLKSGKYKSIDEVIIEAFRLLEEQDKHYEQWVEETRQKVTVGLEQLDRGEGNEVEVVINLLKDKIRGMREA